MSDITRDNSLVTMLLVAYERNEGQSYLSALLTQPLSSIFPMLSSCEMDPQKLKNQFPDASPQELEEKIESNRKSLESACEKLFDGIFDTNRRVPQPITEICGFLHQTIENAMQNSSNFVNALSNSPTSGAFTSEIPPPSDTIEKSSPIKESSQKPKGLMRMLSKKKIEFKLQDKKAEQESPGKNVMIRNMMAQNQEISGSAVELNAGGRETVTDSIAENIRLGQSYLEGGFEAPSAMSSPRISSTTPLTSPPDVETEKAPPPKPTQVAPQPSEFSLKLDIQHKEIATKEDMLRRPTMGVSLGNLSVAEKVVGSFLFLRFIVPGIMNSPAITTPEANGIFLDKITPAMRRGLVLCGKMVTSLCNDNEFGHKDMSLMPCNEFLIPHRQRMKAFLGRCIGEPTKVNLSHLVRNSANRIIA
jgi:hypothetical protein